MKGPSWFVPNPEIRPAERMDHAGREARSGFEDCIGQAVCQFSNAWRVISPPLRSHDASFRHEWRSVALVAEIETAERRPILVGGDFGAMCAAHAPLPHQRSAILAGPAGVLIEKSESREDTASAPYTSSLRVTRNQRISRTGPRWVKALRRASRRTRRATRTHSCDCSVDLSKWAQATDTSPNKQLQPTSGSGL
jgi:hypothetical protein